MKSSKKALVTGGAGFIGSNLTKALIQNKYKVTVVDDLSTGYEKNIPTDVNFFHGDISKIKDLDFIDGTYDVVFHLAASVGRKKSIDYPKRDSEINILGTINILEKMRINGIKNIVYSSSAANYGELQMEVIDESHPLNPNCQYGVSKLAAENMIRAYAHLNPINFVALRYFNIFGMNQRFDQYGNVIPIFVDRALRNQDIVIFGDGNQSRDFLNVREVVECNIKAYEDRIVNEIINLGTGTEYSINNLAKHIICISQSSSKIIYKDPREGDVYRCLAENTKMKNLLSISPKKDFILDLKDYINWYKGEIA